MPVKFSRWLRTTAFVSGNPLFLRSASLGSKKVEIGVQWQPGNIWWSWRVSRQGLMGTLLDQGHSKTAQGAKSKATAAAKVALREMKG